jgi:DNA-binding NtrC family response regulator
MNKSDHIPLSVLIVDDEDVMRTMMFDVVSDAGYSAVCASDVTSARAAFSTNVSSNLVITDLSMPGENGVELVRYIRQEQPGISIIVVTGYPDESQVKILEELEVDAFLIKPFTVRQLRFSVLQAAEKLTMRNLRLPHSKDIDTQKNNMGLVGTSSYMLRLRTHIALMAAGDFPVLVHGESGTGKEVIAHAIHQNSSRSARPMITINCAAIPIHLEESEFFGYAKGAFTGAHANKLGIIESADASTVFLDEIGELSLNVQAKLLRVLDTGEFTRVGDTVTRKADIRIVSATNRHLEDMVKAGLFRKDLFYRLRGAAVETSPLCEHRDDIPDLLRYFLNVYHSDKEISHEALDILVAYAWPGNIRELRHMAQLLDAAAREQKRINATAVRSILGMTDIKDEVIAVPYVKAKENFEIEYFRQALDRHHGNISQAAKEVGMHRPNLIRKLKELGIVTEEFRH